MRSFLYCPREEYQPINGVKILQPKRAYKVVTGGEWARAEAEGVYEGAPVDLADGFIHLSAAGQVGETLRRHFSGQADLRLVTVDLPVLGDSVRWEPSRGGALFPHIYGPLPFSAVRGVEDIPDGAEARAAFAAALS